MIRVGRVDLLHYRGGLHVTRDIATVVTGAEDRQRVEGARIGIVRILAHELLHGVAVRVVTLTLVAVAVHHFDRVQVVALALGAGLGVARLSRRAERRQCGTRGVPILLLPDRVVVSLSLAPIGHGEVRIDLMRCLERLASVFVFEAVQQQQPAYEHVLGFRRARVGERQLTQALFLAPCNARRYSGNEQQDKGRDDPRCDVSHGSSRRSLGVR